MLLLPLPPSLPPSLPLLEKGEEDQGGVVEEEGGKEGGRGGVRSDDDDGGGGGPDGEGVEEALNEGVFLLPFLPPFLVLLLEGRHVDAPGRRRGGDRRRGEGRKEEEEGDLLFLLPSLLLLYPSYFSLPLFRRQTSVGGREGGREGGGVDPLHTEREGRGSRS